MQIIMVTLQKWIWATALVVAISLLPQQSQAADPRLSLGEDATIRIPVGSTDGEVQVMMKVENLTEDLVAAAKGPKLMDLGGAGALPSTKVEFRNPVAIDTGTTSRAWLWIARISKLPANSSQKRSARLSFGKVEQYIEYTVTNLSPATFTWSVAAPGVPWLVWFGFPGTQRATTFVVTTGDYPASNIRLAQSTLRDGLGTSQIALEDLELCESATGPCGHFSVNARSNRTFYVRLKEKTGHGIWQSGKYTGALSFAVNERPELQTVTVTLQASSIWAKLFGALLVALGIILAFFTGVWARARLLRLEALRPVAVLRESITMLIDEIKNTQTIPSVTLDKTRGALTKIENSLDTKHLDSRNLLPPKMPYHNGSSADTSAKLKDYLDKKSQLVDCLTIVICDGMRKPWSKWKQTPSDNIKDAIKKALKALDDVGDKVGREELTNRTDAEREVKIILQSYQNAITPQGILADASLLQVAEPTVHHVSWQITRLSGMLWLVWGILTFIVGVAVLIVTNPGFGTPLDLVFCLLWGFGLPTGIEKLQQASPGGIATTTGMTLPMPKANP